MQPTSSFFKAVAGVLELIESLGAPSDQYGILDAGETLELSVALHNQVKDSPEYQAFESNGGNSYCFDEDEWEVQQ